MFKTTQSKSSNQDFSLILTLALTNLNKMLMKSFPKPPFPPLFSTLSHQVPRIPSSFAAVSLNGPAELQTIQFPLFLFTFREKLPPLAASFVRSPPAPQTPAVFLFSLPFSKVATFLTDKWGMGGSVGVKVTPRLL